MKLRTKTLLVFSLTLFFLVFTLYLSAGSIIFKSFEELEHKDIADEMDLVLDHYSNSIVHTDVAVQHFAEVFGSGTLINDKGAVVSDLADRELREFDQNFLILLDDSGNIIYERSYDASTDGEVPFPQDVTGILSENGPLVPSSENEYSPSGMVVLSDGPAIFSSRPIDLSLNGTMVSTIVVGCYLDQGSDVFFSQLHDIPLQYHILQDPSLDPETGSLAELIQRGQESMYIETVSENTIIGYRIVNDLYGEPAIMLEVSSQRDIYQKAKSTFSYLLYTIIFAGFLYGAVGTVFLERSILSRLSFLTRNVDSIKGDLSSSNEILVPGNDEIASLGSSVNHLMDRLDERDSLLFSIIESMSGGLIVIDEDFKISHIKSKFVTTWEIPGDIIEERDAMKLLYHLKERMVNAEDMVSNVKKNHMTTEITISTIQFKDGTYYEVVATPLFKNETVIGRMFNFEDVTKREISQALIREKEHRYRLLFEHSNDAIFIVKDGIIQDYNTKAFISVFGLCQEMVGKPLFDIVEKNNFSLMHQLEEDAIENSFSRKEMMITRPDALSMDAEVTATVIDADERLIQFIIRDITERKEIERLEQESNERMSLILDNINCGVIVIDANNHEIVDINPTALGIVGFNKEDVIGKECHNFVCPSEKGMCPISDLGMNVDRSERSMIRSDGTMVPVLKSVETVNMGGRELLIESFVDITMIKETEEALLAAKVHAEAANRTKSEFLANMSHELRTPLNSVIGFSDILLEGGFGDLNERQHRFMSNIASSGKHLLNLINDILDISKIEAGKMELFYEVFDFADLMSDIQLMMRPIATKKDLLLDVDMRSKNIYLKADRSKLKQVLYNIIGNSTKFTPENGNIHVIVSVNDDMLNVSVKDTGIGISKEDQQELFKPFVQLDSSSNRKYDGTGLGLALVKNLIELHGGNIWVESEPGEGSNFMFTIPLNIDNKEQIQVRSNEIVSSYSHDSLFSEDDLAIVYPEDSTGKEPLVLVVEDDATSRELISTMLTGAGYRVALVEDGAVALDAAKKLHPFAITLDLNLPEMNGTEVLENLKNDRSTASIPVLILSSLGEQDVGVIVGIEDHLTKPIDAVHLLSALSKLKALSENSSLKVLVIDDDPLVLEMLSEMIRSYGYDVITANGGKEGIDKASNDIPDVLIVDMMMSDMNGFDVISTLKSNPRTVAIPLIVCTARDLDTEEMRLLKRNTYSIIQKGSLEKDSLLEILETLDHDAEHGSSVVSAEEE
ncbi:response regulator [Methanolobus sp. WCC4]|uniref:response regulator n=1 Tax=Methanolobus sp. WCC4 TaxID=3125784 RepID=UPI0030FA232C